MTDLEEPLVSIIIPHRNIPHALARCLDSVVAQRVDVGFEIVVADNSDAPPDVTPWPQARLISTPPTGPGPARNAGAAMARGRHLAFLDADCRAGPGWLQALVDAFATDPETGILAGRIETSPLDGEAWTPGAVFESVFAYKQDVYVRRHRFSSTANLAVRAVVFAEVGGFAGAQSMEDVEWCHRAVRSGHGIRYVEAMTVRHEPRPTLEQLSGQCRRLAHQEHHTHVANGRGRLAYLLRIARVLGYTPPAIVYLLLHPRHGFRERLAALPVLWRIRTVRAAEMIRLALDPHRPQPPWNG
ncbi:MAG: glycosyltransferase [Phenylobacterium sp.]|nr:glycosyltransferase [Phenylobacterium sp.]